jgi:hypothetical protein
MYIGSSTELRKIESERIGVGGMPDDTQLGRGRWPAGFLLERERKGV